MPPVIVGVAAGVAAAAVTTTLTAVALGVAAAIGTVALQNSLKPDAPQVSVDPMDNQSVTTHAAQVRKIIYGETVVGGQLVGYRKIEEDDDDFHLMVFHIAGHHCESAEIYQIEGKSTAELSNHVTSTFYLGDQTTADNTARLNIEGWTTEHVGFNQTYAVLKIKIDSDIFPAGVNEIKFLVKGKRVYDPRLDTTKGGSGSHREDTESTWEWSDNPQLIAIDYARFHGYDVQPSRRFDWDFVALAANFCDGLVDYTDENGDPQQEKRYTCNGALNNGMRPSQGLKAIMQSMGAKPYRIGGKIYIKPAMYTGPATNTLEVNLADAQASYRPHRPEREKCNTVACRYMAKDKKHQYTDAPVLQNTDRLAADGKELIHDLNLPMTNSETMAMRLANHALQRNLEGFIVDYPLNGLHIELTPGSNVTLVDTETGINKEFIIEAVKFSTKNNNTLVTMIEDGPEIYPDDLNPTRTATPNTQLETELPTTPSGVVFEDIYDGTFQKRVAWTNPYYSTEIIISWIKEVAPGFTSPIRIISQSIIGDDEYYIQGLPQGNFTLQLRAVDRLNRRSNWLFNQSFSIDQANTPTNPIVRNHPGHATITLPTPTAGYDYQWKVNTESNFNTAEDRGTGASLTINTQRDVTYYVWYRITSAEGDGDWLSTTFVGQGLLTDNFDDGINDILSRAGTDGVLEQSIDKVAGDLVTVDTFAKAGIARNTMETIDAISQYSTNTINLINNFSALKGLVVELDETVGQMQISGSGITASDINALQISINANTASISSITATQSTINGQVTLHTSQIAQNSSDILLLQETLNGSEFGSLEVRLNSQENKIVQNAISAQFANLNLISEIVTGGQARRDLIESAERLALAQSEIQANTDELSAQASQLTTTATTADDGLSLAQSLVQTISDGDQQIATNLNTLKTEKDQEIATLTAVQQSLVSDGLVMAQDITGLQTSVGTNQSSITTLNEALTTETNTRAGQYTELSGAIGAEGTARTADINAVTQLIVDEENARIEAVNTINGTLNDEQNGLVATFDLAQSAFTAAGPTGANAQSITTLSNAVNDAETGLGALLTLTTNLNTRTENLATFALETDVNGFVSGIYNQNDGTTASYKIKTNEFEIVDATSGNAILKRDPLTNTWEFDGNLKSGGGIFTGSLSGVDGDFSGSITALSGTIGGWSINTNTIKSSATGRRIEMDATNDRITVIDSNNTVSVAMGYLSGLAKNDGSGNFGVADYGFWAKDGDQLVIDGQVSYDNGEFILQSDGALRVFDASAEVIRIGYGTDTAPDKKGIYFFDGVGTSNSNVVFKLVEDFIQIGKSQAGSDYLFYDATTGQISISGASLFDVTGTFKGNVHDDANVRGTIDGEKQTLSNGTVLPGARLNNVGGTFIGTSSGTHTGDLSFDDGTETALTAAGSIIRLGKQTGTDNYIEWKGGANPSLRGHFAALRGVLDQVTGTLNGVTGTFSGTANGEYERIRGATAFRVTNQDGAFVWAGPSSTAVTEQQSTNGYFCIGESGTTYIETLQVFGTLTETSDERTKENITPMEGGLTRVNEYKPVCYNRTGKSETECGFIAQQVEKVQPMAVSTDAETGFKAISYTRLIPDLVNAIQELTTLNKALFSRVEQLEKQGQQ